MRYTATHNRTHTQKQIESKCFKYLISIPQIKMKINIKRCLRGRAGGHNNQQEHVSIIDTF